MSTVIRLWGGPSDGEEVAVDGFCTAFFVTGPLVDPDDDWSVRLKGRYQYDSTTHRYEWMGYE